MIQPNPSNSSPTFPLLGFGFHVPAERALDSNEKAFEPYYKQPCRRRKAILTYFDGFDFGCDVTHRFSPPDLKHTLPVPALGKLVRPTARSSGEKSGQFYALIVIFSCHEDIDRSWCIHNVPESPSHDSFDEILGNFLKVLVRIYRY